MKKRLSSTLAMVLALILLGCTAARVESQEIPRLPIDELQAQLGDPQLIILDVRSPFDWEDSTAKIKGAIREDPTRIDWAEKYDRDKTLVLYCT